MTREDYGLIVLAKGMQKANFVRAAIIVWLICIGSMIGVHFLLKPTPKRPVFGAEARVIYQSLDEEGRRHIVLLEAGIQKSIDGSFHIIGLGHEVDTDALLDKGKLSARRIDFRLPDPLYLERTMMAGEAFKMLNNAEKRCYIDGYASILFHGGDYYFYFDPDIYQRYVTKYGTDCQTCKELGEKSQINGGE